VQLHKMVREPGAHNPPGPFNNQDFVRRAPERGD
jgi:hypothetical protein